MEDIFSKQDIAIRDITYPNDERGRSPECYKDIAIETAGLPDRGVLNLVKSSHIPPNSNFIGSRFFLAIKEVNTTQEKLKALLVIQGHRYRDRKNASPNSHTLHFNSLRMVLTAEEIR